jgi:hypothetical protein
MQSSPYGRFRPILSADLVEWIEQSFVDRAPEETKVAARTEALHEFQNAEIELVEGDTFASRSGDVEWYRLSLEHGTIRTGAFVVAKPSGINVQMKWSDSGNWTSEEPDKPAIVFERV